MTAPRRATPQRAASRRANLSLADYLQKILTARVYDVAIETPLELARRACRSGSATACC